MTRLACALLGVALLTEAMCLPAAAAQTSPAPAGPVAGAATTITVTIQPSLIVAVKSPASGDLPSFLAYIRQGRPPYSTTLLESPGSFRILAYL